jgi:hypothetical protein
VVGFKEGEGRMMKKATTKRDWTKEYNDLPYETRVITGAVSMQDQINGLQREKQRLKMRYSKSIKEINDHIKNIEQSLKRQG